MDKSNNVALFIVQHASRKKASLILRTSSSSRIAAASGLDLHPKYRRSGAGTAGFLLPHHKAQVMQIQPDEGTVQGRTFIAVHEGVGTRDVKEVSRRLCGDRWETGLPEQLWVG